MAVDKKVETMIRIFETAREMSTYNDCAIYAFSNGENIKIVAGMDWFEEAKAKLIGQGYWIAGIFENGNQVYA